MRERGRAREREKENQLEPDIVLGFEYRLIRGARWTEDVVEKVITYICCQIPCDDAGPAPICYWAGVQLGDS